MGKGIEHTKEWPNLLHEGAICTTSNDMGLDKGWNIGMDIICSECGVIQMRGNFSVVPSMEGMACYQCGAVEFTMRSHDG